MMRRIQDLLFLDVVYSGYSGHLIIIQLCRCQSKRVKNNDIESYSYQNIKDIYKKYVKDIKHNSE